MLALAVATPFVLAGEQDLLHIPDAEEFRTQHISKTDHESGWPFTVDEGYLSCVFVMGTRAVYFTEAPFDGQDVKDLRVAIVSTNPLDIAFGNLGTGGLVQKADSIEQLIALMAPFESLGQRLCDQPPGTQIGPGEL